MSAEFSLDWGSWEKLEYFLDAGSSSFLICKEPESCRGTHHAVTSYITALTDSNAFLSPTQRV